MEKLISEFSLGLFFWQSLIFVSLIFLLKKFAWKPILNAVNERETSIKDAMLAAEKARTEMESLKLDNQKILKEARSQKETLLKEANNTKNEIIKNAKNEAKIEAKKILTQAQEAIQNEKRMAIKDLKDQVGSIALEIAEKVLQNELKSQEKQMKLVNQLLEDTNLNK